MGHPPTFRDVEYLGIWNFGDVKLYCTPPTPPVNNWVSDRAGSGPGVIKGRGYMERPQNRQGSCLGTWEGPADGRSRLAAFFFFFFGFFGAKFTQLANYFFQNG